jgi:nicotinate-nucleotide adenylyltransferase
MRLGILGGTFDPVHHGHLDAAAVACEALALDRIVLVPSRVPPHRQQPVASGYHRFAMVALAIQGLGALRASDMELRREGPSYTAVTLSRLAARGFTPSQLFFITGADAFAEIATWHAYPAVLEASHFVVISRPGHAGSVAARLPSLASRVVEVRLGGPAPDGPTTGSTVIYVVTAPTTDVSATEVRQRLAEGTPVDDLVPAAVAEYARRHALYAAARTPADLLHDES